MNEIIYIKTPQCTELSKPRVLLQDFLTVYTENPDLKQNILSLPFYSFDPDKKGQLIVSILKIIEQITKQFPGVCVVNLGEEDFILEYSPSPQGEKVKELVFSFLICLVAFFGGGYAIMCYNTDSGVKDLFINLSMLLTGNAKSGTIYLIITYAIGLTAGMVLFFNHFGGKKLSADPTPLEIQMRLYENDIGTTVIKDMSRRGESIDTKQPQDG